jgi:hypothetical protein
LSIDNALCFELATCTLFPLDVAISLPHAVVLGVKLARAAALVRVEEVKGPTKSRRRNGYFSKSS